MDKERRLVKLAVCDYFDNLINIVDTWTEMRLERLLGRCDGSYDLDEKTTIVFHGRKSTGSPEEDVEAMSAQLNARRAAIIELLKAEERDALASANASAEPRFRRLCYLVRQRKVANSLPRLWVVALQGNFTFAMFQMFSRVFPLFWNNKVKEANLEKSANFSDKQLDLYQKVADVFEMTWADYFTSKELEDCENGFWSMCYRCFKYTMYCYIDSEPPPTLYNLQITAKKVESSDFMAAYQITKFLFFHELSAATLQELQASKATLMSATNFSSETIAALPFLRKLTIYTGLFRAFAFDFDLPNLESLKIKGDFNALDVNWAKLPKLTSVGLFYTRPSVSMIEALRDLKGLKKLKIRSAFTPKNVAYECPDWMLKKPINMVPLPDGQIAAFKALIAFLNDASCPVERLDLSYNQIPFDVEITSCSLRAVLLPSENLSTFKISLKCPNLKFTNRQEALLDANLISNMEEVRESQAKLQQDMDEISQAHASMSAQIQTNNEMLKENVEWLKVLEKSFEEIEPLIRVMVPVPEGNTEDDELAE